jgi:hypothetical protein
VEPRSKKAVKLSDSGGLQDAMQYCIAQQAGQQVKKSGENSLTVSINIGTLFHFRI